MLTGLAGICAGSLVYFAASRILTTLLFEVQPINAFSLTVASLGVLALSGIGAYVPAMRAAATDPVMALKAE